LTKSEKKKIKKKKYIYIYSAVCVVPEKVLEQFPFWSHIFIFIFIFKINCCGPFTSYYSKTASQQSSRQISQWMNVTMDDCNFHFRYHSKNSQQSSRQLSQWMNVTMDECNFPFGPTLFLRKFPSVSQPVSPFFVATLVEHFTSYLRLLLS
jgi:hypothetical protein